MGSALTWKFVDICQLYFFIPVFFRLRFPEGIYFMNDK
jgi:hypothetical protein